MHLKFTLTVEEFREAAEATATASSRPNRGSEIAIVLWQMAVSLITATMVLIYDPLLPQHGLLNQYMVLLVIPSAPWIGLFIYIYWFRSRTAKNRQLLLLPWDRPQHDFVKPTKTHLAWRRICNSLIILTMSVVLAGTGLRQMQSKNHNPSDLFVLGLGISGVPWGAHLALAAFLQVCVTNRYGAKRAWDSQTHLHEERVIEIDASGLRLETPHSTHSYRWAAFPGMIETQNLFLLYHSAATFSIVPKRAFASTEQAAAFRNIAINEAGKQPSAFPVIPIATASAPPM